MLFLNNFSTVDAPGRDTFSFLPSSKAYDKSFNAYSVEKAGEGNSSFAILLNP